MGTRTFSFSKTANDRSPYKPICCPGSFKSFGTAIAVLTCASAVPIIACAPKVSFPESRGDPKVPNRILIAYASVRGSTGEVAQAVAETVTKRGFAVDLLTVKKVRDLKSYRAVVIGSAIRFGKWLSEASDFVRDHREQLAQVPTSYFTVCITLRENTAETRAKAYGFLEPVRQMLRPKSEGWFAGKIDYDRAALWERLLGKAMKIPGGDFRDWDAIRKWAEQVPLSN